MLTQEERVRLQFAFLQCAFVTAIWFFGSWMGITGFLLQAGVTVFLLEAVSYIENYGLLRAKSADGKCEPMSPEHSWDSYGRFSNYLVFQLQRHADHHSHPTRALADLRTASDAPKLPAGYPFLIGVAMVPWAWRKMMNPLVLATRSEK